ncbi:general transcription factor IIF subunit 2 [Pseudomyrmex gracilis]|uniref:general transcription factor IIF subunit 2 n=1 Tax=Pseudomyrmex gracilis TaxID=219809 RepID=UPI0009949826|nr:general transcription factor IIF subunit 2 [Pseudomyrmex gracilis]
MSICSLYIACTRKICLSVRFRCSHAKFSCIKYFLYFEKSFSYVTSLCSSNKYNLIKVHSLKYLDIADNCYMKLKLESIKRASVPQRQVQQLDRVVQNFKPVSDHKHNIEYAEKKKAEGKKMRDDKDAVLDMLFVAFEKHQYYNIRDLVKITRQPIVYLKEILNEVCNYNLKNPHRNMWELKPEYRHYKDEEKSGENISKKGNESEDD